jgi:hypothetical protein
MNYEQFRGQINSGDVLVWTHRGWGSWYDIQLQLIKMATRSEYCHVGVAWVVGGRVFIVEAVVPKVRIYPLSKEVPFYHIPCGDDYWNDSVEEYALSKIGEEYSKLEAIKGGINTLRTGENDFWQCSELVNSILVKGNIFKDGDVISTPSAVVYKLQELGYQLRMITK